MKRSIAALAALSTVSTVGAPTVANADPDIHMPVVQTGYCPGGRGSMPLQVVPGAEYGANAIYCDGVSYADGSHWRYIIFPIPRSMVGNQEQVTSEGLHCVINDELVNSSLAPSGGCEGAV
jgi:hypothetical protein